MASDIILKKLEIRKQIKRRKPNFIRPEAHKCKTLDPKWRKPKGITSKVRLQRKGKRLMPRNGFGSPSEVRFMTPDGFMPVVVNNISDLAKLDPKKQGVVVSANVGDRKRTLILEEAKKRSLKIVNFKNPQSVMDKIAADIKQRKENREKKMLAKEERKKKAVAAKEKEEKKKEHKENELSDEDKKEAERKEQEKVLTQKG